MKTSLLFRACLLPSIAGILLASLGLVAQPAPSKIRVICTSDTVGYLEPPCN